MLKIINEINRTATVGAAEINRIAIEGKTRSLQRISAELLPNALTSHSRNFFNRQTLTFDEMPRWSITGRFKFWLALLNFGAPNGFDYTRARVEAFCDRLEALRGEENALKGFPTRIRSFFEIKEEFDAVTSRMATLYVGGMDHELKKLIKRQHELLKEIENGVENGAAQAAQIARI